MASYSYDLAIIGGGLGGSALGLAMARRGARVLLIEREEVFRDRVRGEGMTPWGCAEARELGIYDLLRDACGNEVRFFDTYAGPACIRRDLPATTPQRLPAMTFLHPEMQEHLLQAAIGAGVEVRRGASVSGITPGSPPRISVSQDGKVEEIPARLVVGVDGRSSHARTWAGFSVNQDPHRLYIGGVLLEGTAAPADAVSLVQGFGRGAIFFPQRDGRCRAYILYHRDVLDDHIAGPTALPAFLEQAILAGTPAAWVSQARAIGPLATFEGADSWVPHPYRDGVVLIGDAAAASDPSWGQGLSLTLRDVRTLRDQLLAQDDWDRAGHAYAEAHDGYYATLRAVEDWNTRLFMEVGEAADARRARALPLIMADPTRVPDVLMSGPMQPLGEADRIRFIGE